jgi:hypothetical protein
MNKKIIGILKRKRSNLSLTQKGVSGFYNPLSPHI